MIRLSKNDDITYINRENKWTTEMEMELNKWMKRARMNELKKI